MIVLGQPRDPLKYGIKWFSLCVSTIPNPDSWIFGFSGAHASSSPNNWSDFYFQFASRCDLTVKCMPLQQGLPPEFSVLGSSLQVAKAGDFALKYVCLEGLI